MAWTKGKTAVVIGVVAILAATPTTIIGIKLARAHHPIAEPTDALSPVMMNMTADIEPDGGVRMKALVEEMNTSRLTIRTDRIGDTDLKIDQITDESGKPMKFIQQPSGAHLVTLNHVVPSGGKISYTVEGTAPHMIKPTSTGIWEFGIDQYPGNNGDMHLIEVWRLPMGATLLAKGQDMNENTNGGQIELRIDKMVPPKGHLASKFSYRFATATN